MAVLARKKSLWILALLSLLLLNYLAFVPIRSFIVAYLNTPESYPTFNDLLQTFYPRLIVERQRFSSTFFLQKYEQIIWRGNISLLLFGSAWLFINNNQLKSYLSKRYSTLSSLNGLNNKHLTILFYLACLYYTYDWPKNLILLLQVKDFYKPVALITWMPLFPTETIIYIIAICYFLLIIGCILSSKKFWWSIGVAILFIFQLGLLQSFEKIDHTFSIFTYGILLMPLLQLKNIVWQGMGIVFIKLSIGLGYFFSASEKLITSGISWLNGETLAFHLQNYLTKEHWLLIGNLPQLASICIILFQLFFIFAIVSGKGVFLFMLGGLIFHLSNALLLDIGGLDNPWLFMYIFLWDNRWKYSQNRKLINPIKK